MKRSCVRILALDRPCLACAIWMRMNASGFKPTQLPFWRNCRVYAMTDQNEDAEEAGFANKNLPGLPAALPVAEKVGDRLGRRAFTAANGAGDAKRSPPRCGSFRRTRPMTDSMRRTFRNRADLIHYLLPGISRCWLQSMTLWPRAVWRQARAGAAPTAIDPARYGSTRNDLDGAVTHLSPYLRHGIISEAETCARRKPQRPAPVTPPS